MSTLYLEKEIVNHYKEIKGIRYDSDLLKKIGHELGYKNEVLNDWILTTKGNFSKMLLGKRPLNKDYIVPLEKIFGVPIAKLIEPEAYKFLDDKDNIPFVKGIKYYAYKDDMELYKNELSHLVDKRNNLILFNIDEYGKTFLDYIIEYNSVNGIKYLYEVHKIKMKWFHNTFIDKDRNLQFYFQFNNYIPLAKTIANMNDTNLFFDIYDSYFMYITNGHYGDGSCIFDRDEFLSIILEHDNLFKDIFIKKDYSEKVVCGKSERIIRCNMINPIINGCLRCSINNLDKYRNQAIEILKFAIEHNKSIINAIGKEDVYDFIARTDGLKKLNAILNHSDSRDLIIYYDGKVEDEEINDLLKQLT